MAKATVIPVNNKRFAEVVDTCHKRFSNVISDFTIKSEVLYTIPFKIRIKNIKVPGYGPGNVPPIGIAIIGVNNYIL